MSILKSSAEDLTLNADGSGNDIIFQSNGSTVATLDQAGTLTATTFTGAATDSTKLPLAGGTMTGNISHASDFTLDIGGDILLDADGAEIRLLDAGSDFGKLFNDTAGGDGNFVIKSQNNDKDIIFQGKDGSSTIEAMRIDMSVGGKVGIGTNSPDTHLHVTGGSTTIRAEENGGSYVQLQAGGSTGYVDTKSGHDLVFRPGGSEKMRINSSGKVSLGGSTAVTVDSQVAIHGGNLELTTAGSRYWVARASDAALTGSLYSPSGSVVRLSSEGTSGGSIELKSSSIATTVTIDTRGDIDLGHRHRFVTSVIHDLGTMAADATVTVSQGIGCNGAYEITVWNSDGNAYGHGLYTFCCGGYNSNFTIQTPFESHYGATEVPTVSMVRLSGCNWQLRVTNEDADSKHFYASMRCIHST